MKEVKMNTSRFIVDVLIIGAIIAFASLLGYGMLSLISLVTGG